MTVSSIAATGTGTPPARTDSPWLARVIVLCPLAAVANSLATGVVLGLASVLLLGVTSLLPKSTRDPPEAAARLNAVLLVVAATVTIMELVLKAFLFEPYAVNGAFLPLVVATGAILGGALAPSASRPQSVALMEALRHGAEIAAFLIIVGGLRELLSGGFTLARVPAGAFLALALLVAARAAVTAR